MLIPPRVFNIARVASKDLTRPSLNGLHVARQEEKPCAEATNGRLLIRSEWKEDPAEEYPIATVDPKPQAGFQVIIPTGAALQAAAWKYKGPKAILENVAVGEQGDGELVPMSFTDLDTTGTVSPARIRETFPDTARVFGKEKDRKATVRVDLVLLRDLIDALLKVHPPEAERRGEVKTRYADLQVFKPDQPVQVVVGDSTVQTTGLICPLVQ